MARLPMVGQRVEVTAGSGVTGIVVGYGTTQISPRLVRAGHPVDPEPAVLIEVEGDTFTRDGTVLNVSIISAHPDNLSTNT